MIAADVVDAGRPGVALAGVHREVEQPVAEGLIAAAVGAVAVGLLGGRVEDRLGSGRAAETSRVVLQLDNRARLALAAEGQVSVPGAVGIFPVESVAYQVGPIGEVQKSVADIGAVELRVEIADGVAECRGIVRDAVALRAIGGFDIQDTGVGGVQNLAGGCRRRLSWGNNHSRTDRHLDIGTGRQAAVGGSEFEGVCAGGREGGDAGQGSGRVEGHGCRSADQAPGGGKGLVRQAVIGRGAVQGCGAGQGNTEGCSGADHGRLVDNRRLGD